MKLTVQNLPKAPRQFQVVDEETWIGKPSVSYGVVRRMAHEQRKLLGEAYMRVLYGEAGRKGDPWGGLGLETNGELFHFSAGVKKWPQFHDGNGNLTPAGEQSLASGIPGFLSTSRDWRWVQDEVDLTSVLSITAIEHIAAHFRQLLEGKIPIPMFQAQIWAKRLGVEINQQYHNCTTIILEQIRERTELLLHQRMPLPAVDALQAVVGNTRSALDDELNYFLSMPEAELEVLLKAIATHPYNADWKEFAKGTATAPEWLTWQSLISASPLNHGEQSH